MILRSPGAIRTDTLSPYTPLVLSVLSPLPGRACAPPPACAPSAFPPPRDRPQPLPQDQPPTGGVPPRPLPCASVFRSFPCKPPPFGQFLPVPSPPPPPDRTPPFHGSQPHRIETQNRGCRIPFFPPPPCFEKRPAKAPHPRHEAPPLPQDSPPTW